MQNGKKQKRVQNETKGLVAKQNDPKIVTEIMTKSNCIGKYI